MKRTIRAVTVALAAALLLAAAPAARAQVVTENAGVISPETPLLRESVSHFEAENLREVRLGNQFILGLDPTRELKLTVPFLWREAEFPGADGREAREGLFGLGDISLRFKQSLFQEDDVMESTRFAALAELRAPTGDDDETEAGVEIPRRLQLGTGDFGFGGGAVFTLIRDRHRFSTEALFRHRTRHEGARLGQTVDWNAAYWYRLLPARFDAETTLEVRGVLEVLATYRFASDLADRRDDDDGLIVWLAPGIQIYPSRSLLFEANVEVPVYQDLDDSLGDRRFAASVIVKVLF